MTGIKRPLRLGLPGMELMARWIYGIDIKEISPVRGITLSDTPVLIIHDKTTMSFQSSMLGCLDAR